MGVAPSFGGRVDSLRELVPDMSLREVDRLAGLTEGMTQQYVSGSKVEPRKSTSTALAAVFGCTWIWLFSGEGKAPRREDVIRAVEAARAVHAA
jgi:transcriptional regulator with XRE-family HTH domain